MQPRHIIFALFLLILSLKYSLASEKNLCFPADTCHQIGRKLIIQGKFLESIPYNKAAINLRTTNKDTLLWQSYRNTGYAYYGMNQYSEAKKYYVKAYQLYKNQEAKDAIKSIHLLRILGDIYYELGELERAEDCSNKALLISIENPVLSMAYILKAKVLSNYEDATMQQQALDYADKAIQICEEDNSYLLYSLIEKGNILNKLQHFGKAIEVYKITSNKYIELGDTVSCAQSLNNIATVFYYQKKHGKAIKQLKESFELLKAYYEVKFNYNYAAPHENLADNYTALQQFHTALLHYQKALINLTNNFRNENIFQNPNPKDTLLFIYSNPDIIRVLHLKATAAYQYYQQNNNIKYLTLANQTYQTAFDFHDKLQKEISTENSRLFQAKNIVPYIENALKITYQQQQNGQDISKAAFRFMEKNKATVLLQSMNEADALQYANLPDSLLEQEKDLKIAITFHKKQLNEAIEYEETTEIERLDSILFEEKQEYSQLINQLENNYPDYYRLKYQQNQTQLVDVQNTLDAKTALLEYFVGDSAIYILSIQKEASQLYELPKPKNWQSILDDFRLALTDSLLLKDGIDRYKTVFVESGHQLYQWLLKEPLTDLEAPIDRLQIIPDGALNFIPFELLLTEKVDSHSIDYRKLPYVLRHKSLGYLYAGAFLIDQKKAVSNDTLLSLAGFSANYQNSALGALPFSETCVRQLSKKYEGTSFTNATKQNFIEEAAKYKTLLFAMHAKLDDKNAMNSALIFSPTADSLDNQLRAADLYNTTLNAEMAVLSACETGLGKINKGEGVMSLSRAFTYAGCPSLVMSLWSIPNKSTALLTKSFFENLNKGLTKDRALQQIKLAYLDTIPSRLAHPVYWAGLVATGDLSPVDMVVNRVAFYIGWLFCCLFLVCSIIYIRSKRKLPKRLSAECLIRRGRRVNARKYSLFGVY